MLAVLPAWMLQPARGRRVGQKMEFNPQSKLLPLDQHSLHLCSRDGCLEPWEGMRAVLGLSREEGAGQRGALLWHVGFSQALLFFPGKIKVEVLPPIETKGLTSDDVSDLTDRCFHTMRETLFRLSGRPSPSEVKDSS